METPCLVISILWLFVWTMNPCFGCLECLLSVVYFDVAPIKSRESYCAAKMHCTCLHSLALLQHIVHEPHDTPCIPAHGPPRAPTGPQSLTADLQLSTVLVIPPASPPLACLFWAAPLQRES